MQHERATTRLCFASIRSLTHGPAIQRVHHLRAPLHSVMHFTFAECLSDCLSCSFLAAITISRVENLEIGDGIYFAFITGLSIGYGDITPVTAWGRVVSVFIGLIGMIFVGVDGGCGHAGAGRLDQGAPATRKMIPANTVTEVGRSEQKRGVVHFSRLVGHTSRCFLLLHL